MMKMMGKSAMYDVIHAHKYTLLVITELSCSDCVIYMYMWIKYKYISFLFPMFIHGLLAVTERNNVWEMDIESPPWGNKWQNLMRLWHSLTDFSGDNNCSLSTYLCIIVAYFCIHFQSLKGGKNQYWCSQSLFNCPFPCYLYDYNGNFAKFLEFSSY